MSTLVAFGCTSNVKRPPLFIPGILKSFSFSCQLSPPHSMLVNSYVFEGKTVRVLLVAKGRLYFNARCQGINVRTTSSSSRGLLLFHCNQRM
mmetsp:Transcript_49720/g.127892  ORF Transcript_49720/g.127892 Transcript_49720/m.127892 type:complete len:92 (-) Transcript_49720:16-291(-)